MTAVLDGTETAARIAKSIEALPPLPATAERILNCFGDEFIDAKKVATVVEGDPGICARLLGLSNSAYYGLAEPVNTISEAISRVLGVDTVRALVLAMAVQKSFNSKDCSGFDAERFWMQSLMAADCCKKIALADEQAEDDDRDLAYLAGLCHNLGLMALAHMEPERTNAALARHQSEGRPDSLGEIFNDEFNTDHCVLTAELARCWSLPVPIVSAYQHRAFPQTHCDVRLSLIVAAGVCATENTEADQVSCDSLGAYADELGIPAEDLQGMANVSERQIEEIQSLANNMTV